MKGYLDYSWKQRTGEVIKFSEIWNGKQIVGKFKDTIC